MSEKQQLMWLRAMRSIVDGQVREARRERAPRTNVYDAGYIRHINCSAEQLSPEARAVYDRGKAETQEEYQAILPYLKEIRITRVEPLPRGKDWRGTVGKKEAERAAKRLAKKENGDES